MLYGAFEGEVTTVGVGWTSGAFTTGGVETGAVSGASSGAGATIGCGTDGMGDMGVTGDSFLGKLGCNPC